jgi:hypothetical protein
MKNNIGKKAREDIKFLLSFTKNLHLEEEIPRDMFSTHYLTLSYEGDLELKNRIIAIRKYWGIDPVKSKEG